MVEKDGVKYKSGRFSQQEKQLLINYLQNYVKENGIEVSQLLAMTRDDGVRVPRSSVWKELGTLLPHRTRNVSVHRNIYFLGAYLSYTLSILLKAIFKRGVRLLMRQEVGITKWGPAEDSNLLELVRFC